LQGALSTALDSRCAGGWHANRNPCTTPGLLAQMGARGKINGAYFNDFPSALQNKFQLPLPALSWRHRHLAPSNSRHSISASLIPPGLRACLCINKRTVYRGIVAPHNLLRRKARYQNGSTWMRFPSRRTSDAATSLSCRSRVLTLAAPVNSLSPGPAETCIRVTVLPIHFLS
jgi:hypothetical protein